MQGEEPKEITGKAVVVTTGGFGASEEYIQTYRPDLEGYVTTNQVGSTGDGIKMIEKIRRSKQSIWIRSRSIQRFNKTKDS